jgi:hypothetical protein
VTVFARILIVTLLCAACAAPVLPVWAQSTAPVEAPLPEIETLVREVRQHLEPDSTLLSQYTYKERRRDVKVSKLGKVHLGPWRDFEIYPSRVPGETYKRLVAVDGTPLPPDELARRDEAHRTHVLDRQARIAAETPAERQKRLAKRAKEEREEREAVDEVFRVYRMEIVRRETRDRRPTLLVSLTPREDVRTRTEIGDMLKRMHGFVWVDEADRQVVRVEMTVTRDITLGFGLLARLDAGSTLMFRRARVNGEIWLPAEATFKSAGRSLVFRKFDLETTTYFSDYRKFDVSTSEEVTR